VTRWVEYQMYIKKDRFRRMLHPRLNMLNAGRKVFGSSYRRALEQLKQSLRKSLGGDA
jgi:hypothetical protein